MHQLVVGIWGGFGEMPLGRDTGWKLSQSTEHILGGGPCFQLQGGQGRTLLWADFLHLFLQLLTLPHAGKCCFSWPDSITPHVYLARNAVSCWGSRGQKPVSFTQLKTKGKTQQQNKIVWMGAEGWDWPAQSYAQDRRCPEGHFVGQLDGWGPCQGGTDDGACVLVFILIGRLTAVHFIIFPKVYT